MNENTAPTILGKLNVNRMTGEEPFRLGGNRLDATLLEFWQWSCSDLVGNALRGVLAEYIVGLALGCLNKVREEWDAVDLEWDAEDNRTIRIEVKSAAYLQSWAQEKLSSISFDIASKRSWDAKSNVIAADALRSSDVYVFCLLHHDNKMTIDPLDLSQWSFYAVSSKQIHHEFGNQQRVSLSPLEKIHGRPCLFPEVKSRVETAATWQPPS